MVILDNGLREISVPIQSFIISYVYIKKYIIYHNPLSVSHAVKKTDLKIDLILQEALLSIFCKDKH